MNKTDPDRTIPAPANHEYASPESGDRAQPTGTGAHSSGPATDPIKPEPQEKEFASPESGDRDYPPQSQQR